MRLKYNILWVDDRKSNFEKLGYDTEIQNYVKELFLDPSLIFCETAQDARNMISSQRFDLILSDYNIDAEKGDDFIRHVRGQNVNTEILFYSAQTTVPGLDVDRISFFSIPKIDGYPQLYAKMEKLVLLTIEKLRDLTAIRGLVMAETSELDKMMEDILNVYFVEKQTNESDTTFNEIIQGLETDHKNKLTKPNSDCKDGCTHTIKEKSIDEMIVSRDFDSSRKARAINKIIEKVSFIYQTTKSNFYDDYISEINSIRNDLAHSHSEIRNGIEVLITKKKNDNEIIFDDAKFKEIRQNILRHVNILNDLKEYIISQSIIE